MLIFLIKNEYNFNNVLNPHIIYLVYNSSKKVNDFEECSIIFKRYIFEIYSVLKNRGQR